MSADATKIAADVAEEWASVRVAGTQLGFGVHAVVTHAEKVAHGGGCGYYHRGDLVAAAAFLLEAIARLDESDDPPHDCERPRRVTNGSGES